MNFKITGKIYDFVKWFSRCGLPALTLLAAILTAALPVLVPAISTYEWGVPIVGFLSALCVLLNRLIEISKSNFYKQLEEEGVINLEEIANAIEEYLKGDSKTE